MEDEAQLVSADDGRPDDSGCRAAGDGQARQRDRRRGQRQSRDLRVAAASGREPDREGRERRAGDCTLANNKIALSLHGPGSTETERWAHLLLGVDTCSRNTRSASPALFWQRWPALSPVQPRPPLRHPNIMIKRRASTD